MSGRTLQFQLTRCFVVAVTMLAGMSGKNAVGHDPVPAPHGKAYQAMFPEPTAVLATDVPDRILVSWANSPDRSFSVTWRSLESPDAVAEFAPATDGPEFTKNIQRVAADTAPLATNLGQVHMHAATFSGLEPNTLYVYRVGNRRTVSLPSGDAKGVEQHTQDYAWSEWIHVRTAAPFRGEVTPARFVYFGDAQNDLKSHWSRVVREAFRDAPEMTFMLHAGDLVNRGNRDEEWGQWFHAGDFLLSSIPQLAIPGNHEYDVDPAANMLSRVTRGRGLSTRWPLRFEFPQNGPEGSSENIFYVDVQGIRLIGLDSNIDPKSQAVWLEEVLKNNPNRWTIVTHHHPIHSTSRGRDNAGLRDAWQPLYDKYGVDLVLQGHDHSYGRTAPLERNETSGKQVVREQTGTVYVVSVSGPKQYSLKDYEEAEENPFESRGEDLQLYQVIDVTHDRISYQAKTATGRLYDQFEIIKADDGEKKFVSPEETATE